MIPYSVGRRLVALARELPGALALSVLTAVTTILLAIVISVVVGSENDEHRLATRCFAHQTNQLLRVIIENAPSLDHIDLDRYPPISVDGIDCSSVFENVAEKDAGQ